MIEIDLEKLADEIMRVEHPTYEQAIPGLREAIIRKKWRIKHILERYIKQTAEAEGAKKKKVLEGCLCIPYSCEGLLLLDENSAKECRELRKKLRSKNLTEEERDECSRRLWEIERKGQWIDEVLGDLEGKKVRITVEVVGEEGEMKRHLTEEDIRKIFTDPNSLRKTLVLWKTAERRGLNLVRKMINERKKLWKR